MKKLLLLSVLTITVFTIMAQVPDSIGRRFSQDYPNVKNQTWKTEDNRYRVTYMDDNNMEQSILYDRTGQVYGRSSELQTSDVPAGVSEYYNKNYPGEKKYKVYRETDNLGVNNYYIDRKGERLYFDGQGTYRKTAPTGVGGNRTTNPGMKTTTP